MATGEAVPVRRLFGTDGVRGVANTELTPELALAIGRGLGSQLPAGSVVLIGRDTRRSGALLESAVAAGLASAGIHVERGGVLPTPAVAELVSVGEQAAGVVISASHNPFPDNGIKLFGPDGFKLPDEQEARIEAAMADDSARRPVADALGTITDWPEGLTSYRDSMVTRFEGALGGLSVVLDCAHGATITTAVDVVTRAGARVVGTLGDAPTGDNINVDCGSTSLAALSAAVVSASADLGLAFDGDGDRVLAVDAAGNVVDGDQILAILALRLKDRGELAHDTVVTTTMTNLGFRRAMRDRGVDVRWTDVGDRYVVAEMRSGGFTIGGEQSGHLINLASGPTGDGLAAGLQLLHAVADSGERWPIWPGSWSASPRSSSTSRLPTSRGFPMRTRSGRRWRAARRNWVRMDALSSGRPGPSLWFASWLRRRRRPSVIAGAMRSAPPLLAHFLPSPTPPTGRTDASLRHHLGIVRDGRPCLCAESSVTWGHGPARI